MFPSNEKKAASNKTEDDGVVAVGVVDDVVVNTSQTAFRDCVRRWIPVHRTCPHCLFRPDVPQSPPSPAEIGCIVRIVPTCRLDGLGTIPTGQGHVFSLFVQSRCAAIASRDRMRRQNCSHLPSEWAGHHSHGPRQRPHLQPNQPEGGYI